MSNYRLFSVLGIEIEYMLVDQYSLNVQPKSDLLLQSLAGELVNEVALGDIALSNELVMHVLELKNNGPKSPQEPIVEHFQHAIEQLQPLLQQHQLMLLPSGAHPWMNPGLETVRWPHGDNQIYQQYHRVFNCEGHGWSNLQSMHVNLPFANDEEFFQLHSLVRLILPLLPALAASSPILDGKITGVLDSRLDYYQRNQQRIPSIAGDIIPEFIRSEQEYDLKIMQPMYADIEPFDPEGILCNPWLNSRGAIPKFDLHAIEIRILDSQECVQADIAIAKALFVVLKHWHQSSTQYLDKPCPTDKLKRLYDQVIRDGLATVVNDPELLAQWQMPNQHSMSVKDIWSQLLSQASAYLTPVEQKTLEYILTQGTLSERILKAADNHPTPAVLKQIYQQLGHCLLTNRQFNP